jgi:tRNA dimethylallyltransferase
MNSVRLIRALEVIEITGKPFSELRKGTIKQTYSIERFGVNWNRADLYQRIDLRVELMIKDGLFEEAKSLFPLRNLKALNTVGYSEFFRYWEDEYDFDEAVEKIKQHTRNYAKRQLTWIKRYSDIVELDPYSDKPLLEQLLSHFNVSD